MQANRLRQLVAIAILLLVVSCDRARVENPTITVSVIGTSDVHGALFPVDGNHGLALFGGYVKTVSRYGKRVQHSKACNRQRPFGLRPNPPATFVEPPWPVRIDLLCISMVFLRSNKCQSAPIT